MERFVFKLSQELDRIAGWSLVATMVLVIGNILLRLLGHPIQGAYEWAGFLTALAIALALAYCAICNGHITITFLSERLPFRFQQVIELAINIIAFFFLALVSWQMGRYATSMVISGEVAPTTRLPFYPLIYLVAFGFLVFCLVILVNVGKVVRQVVRK